MKTMSSTSKNERLLEKSEKIKEQLRSKIEEVDQLSQKLRRVTVAIGQEMEKEREELAQELEKVLDQSEERGSSKSGSGTARPFWERFIGASFSFGLLFFTARQFYLVRFLFWKGWCVHFLSRTPSILRCSPKRIFFFFFLNRTGKPDNERSTSFQNLAFLER